MIFKWIKQLTLSLIFLITFNNLYADKILVLVNEHPIMESQVNELRKNNKKLSFEQATNLVIDKYLMQQFINSSKVTVDDEEINKAVQDIMKRNRIPSIKQFAEILKYQGTSLNSFKNQIAEQIKDFKLKQQFLHQNPNFENDILELSKKLEKESINKNIKLPKMPEYKISHILLKVTPIFDDKQAKNRLNEIKKIVLSGEDTFENIAKKESKDYYSGSKGGSLDWAPLNVYDQTFAQVAHNTKKGKISEPFKSSFGWHILRVDDLRDKDMPKEQYFYMQAQNKLMEDIQKNPDAYIIKQLRKQVDIKQPH